MRLMKATHLFVWMIEIVKLNPDESELHHSLDSIDPFLVYQAIQPHRNISDEC